jgi:hypothetical protein
MITIGYIYRGKLHNIVLDKTTKGRWVSYEPKKVKAFTVEPRRLKNTYQVELPQELNQ